MGKLRGLYLLGTRLLHRLRPCLPYRVIRRDDLYYAKAIPLGFRPAYGRPARLEYVFCWIGLHWLVRWARNLYFWTYQYRDTAFQTYIDNQVTQRIDNYCYPRWEFDEHRFSKAQYDAIVGFHYRRGYHQGVLAAVHRLMLIGPFALLILLLLWSLFLHR